jgi:integrase
MPWLDDIMRAKPKKRVPVVLSTGEVMALMDHCPSTQLLPVQMLYGSGLRVMAYLRLRVGDIDLYACHQSRGAGNHVAAGPEYMNSSGIIA